MPHTRPLAIALAATFLLALLPATDATTVDSTTGYKVYSVNALSPDAWNSYGWPAPVVEKPCAIPLEGMWCLHMKAGWVRYPVYIAGPDGKGYDNLVMSANLLAWGNCSFSLTKGSAHPHDNIVMAHEGRCQPRGFPDYYHESVRIWSPNHNGGQHYLWFYCPDWDSQTCDLRAYSSRTEITGWYEWLVVSVSGVTRKPITLTNPTPDTCATFSVRGSPHHRDVRITLDWGLGPGAAESFDVQLSSSNYEWKETRCKTLPASLIDYNLCLRAQEKSGLRRDVTDCTTADGGIL